MRKKISFRLRFPNNTLYAFFRRSEIADSLGGSRPGATVNLISAIITIVILLLLPLCNQNTEITLNCKRVRSFVRLHFRRKSSSVYSSPTRVYYTYTPIFVYSLYNVDRLYRMARKERMFFKQLTFIYFPDNIERWRLADWHLGSALLPVPTDIYRRLER